jgi:hypothetical protein
MTDLLDFCLFRARLDHWVRRTAEAEASARHWRHEAEMQAAQVKSLTAELRRRRESAEAREARALEAKRKAEELEAQRKAEARIVKPFWR